MASSENRWPEYAAGTLTPPAVVQHDVLNSGEHLIWVWTGTQILGPVSRRDYNPTVVIAEIMEVETPYSITCEDGTVIQV